MQTFFPRRRTLLILILGAKNVRVARTSVRTWLTGRSSARRADEIPVLRKRGYEVNVELLEETGFSVPILVDCKDGLDLRVPPPNFTVQDVENYVGASGKTKHTKFFKTCAVFQKCLGSQVRCTHRCSRC